MTEQRLKFERRYFDPAGAVNRDGGGNMTRPLYLYSDEIVLAVNLARATGRPLFVTGSPGTGKSTLAKSIASILGWRYIEQVVTSRTRARDLLWQFDAVRRLSDAQISNKELPPRSDYVSPKAIWLAADPDTARLYPTPKGSKAELTPRECVVLIDEIDKAEPDVPNDLLEVLEMAQFTVDDLDEQPVIHGDRGKMLIVITSNGERDMPTAFLRRCVVLSLPDPGEDWLVQVASKHFGNDENKLHREVAKLTLVVAQSPASVSTGRRPGTAEYLDAVRACKSLGVQANSDDVAWQHLESIVLSKAPFKNGKRDSA